jgi:plastocyanin
MKDTITVLAPPDVEIGMGDNFFDPQVIQLNIGETVRWTNNGAMPHTATADGGAFDSGTLDPGEFFDFTFASEGVFDYSCIFHPGMIGTLVVGTPDSVTLDIQMIGTTFNPSAAAVTAGEYVRWVNFDPMAHTSTEISGLWDSGTLEPGDFFIYQADSVGSFDYVCSFHPGMTGSLTVNPVADITIEIGEYFFSPAVAQIQLGQVVRWINNGIRVHTTTADGGSWDSDSLSPGESFYFAFPDEGVFDYTCMMHPLLMKGTIVVGRPDSIAHDIRIVDFDFDPASLTVTLGDYIRWINFGAMAHTTTDTSEGLWDSGSLDPGDFFIYRANTPGTFNYVCSFHPGQDGLLIVPDTTSGNNCDYIPGNVNGVAPANGIDVTFGVAYFKGGAAPPNTCPMCPQPHPFYAALDVNGSCTTNGIDITYFVGYLKGGPTLQYCPTCPPVVRASAGR